MVGMSLGLPGRFSLPTPMPMAPEDTRIISCPAFFRSLRTFTRSSTWRMFMRPVEWARVEVPTFTTILISEKPLSGSLCRDGSQFPMEMVLS